MTAPGQSTSIMATAVATVDHSTDPICQWILEQLNAPREGLPVEWISVSLVQGQDAHQELSRWKVSGQGSKHTEASSLTASIKRTAAGSAQFHNSFCQFCVFAWWPDKSSSIHPFSLDASVTRAMLSPTEPATNEGMLKQFMRHNEVSLKLATQGFLQSMEVTERIINQQQQRIDSLEAGRFKVLEMAESLMSAQAERNAEVARAAASEQRKMLAFQQLLDLGPIIKSKILEAVTGQKLATEHPAMMVLRGVFDGMTMEQMQGLLGMFPPEKQLQLLELYKAAMQLRAQPPEPSANTQATSTDSTQAATQSPPQSTETH